MSGKTRRILAIVIVLLVCFGLGMPMALADERSDAVNRRDKAQQTMNQLQGSLDSVNTNLADAAIALQQSEIDLADAEINLTDAKTKEADALRKQQIIQDQLEIAQADLSEVNEQVASNEDKLGGDMKTVGELARQTYQSGGEFSLIALATTAKTTDDFAKVAFSRDLAAQLQSQKMTKVENALALSRNQQNRLQSLKDQVADLKKDADATLKDAQDAAADKQTSYETYNDIVRQKSAAKTQLDSQKKNLESDLANARREQQEAQSRISEIDARNWANSQRTKPVTPVGPVTPVYSNYSGGGGIFRHPIDGALNVTSSYGWRVNPVLGYTELHQGVDLAANCGVPQYATASGTVTAALYDGSGGNSVYINHGVIGGSSWQTVHRHFTSFAVFSGQHVNKGQVIGYTGTTGNSTGCHTHYEIWKNGITINPMSMM